MTFAGSVTLRGRAVFTADQTWERIRQIRRPRLRQHVATRPFIDHVPRVHTSSCAILPEPAGCRTVDELVATRLARGRDAVRATSRDAAARATSKRCPACPISFVADRCRAEEPLDVHETAAITYPGDIPLASPCWSRDVRWSGRSRSERQRTLRWPLLCAAPSRRRATTCWRR